MTLPTLRRIAALAEAGATVVGRRPRSSPSQADDPRVFDTLAGRLWGGMHVTAIGKGRVIDGGPGAEAGLAEIGVVPDVAFSATSSDSSIRFIHRRLPDGDIYFIDNCRGRTERVDASFRVTGKVPQLWHADTGAIEPLKYRIEGSRTIVPMDLGPEGSALIVFREAARQAARNVVPPTLRTVKILGGAWDVRFQPGRGAPASVRLPVLKPLNDSDDPGIRYFSGTATYRKTMVLKARPHSGTPLWLDLGKIGDVAEVRVNGMRAGTVWHAPYRLDVARLVRRGSNQTEVKVADLWVNRLIGDAQPGAKKVTFVAAPTYHADAPLRPSGLIGPVTLLAVEGR